MLGEVQAVVATGPASRRGTGGHQRIAEEMREARDNRRSETEECRGKETL
jgi:hypothetical protein